MTVYKNIRKKDGLEFMFIGTTIEGKHEYVSVDGKVIKKYKGRNLPKDQYDTVEEEISMEEHIRRNNIWNELKELIGY